MFFRIIIKEFNIESVWMSVLLTDLLWFIYKIIESVRHLVLVEQ